MNTIKIESAHTELREQINKYTARLNELSVYNKDELFEKGLLLSNLQNVELQLLETLGDLKNKITEQKQVLEKYMRDAEESFNAVRQNIYNTERKKIKPPTPNTAVAPPAYHVPITAHHPAPSSVSIYTPPINILTTTPSPVATAQHPAATSSLPKAVKPPASKSDGWTVVERKKTVMPKLVKREVAPDLFIQTVTVNKVEEAVNNPGWWCWCPDESRFCISINGKVYAGNTTVIHALNDQPVKFFEHRRCDKVDNWKESDYYVPIEKNPASRDLRHFTNKMKFVPASRTPEKYETYCYRLGSKDTLKDDVLTIKAEDYRLFSDLTCNFLLCLTAASAEMDRRA